MALAPPRFTGQALQQLAAIVPPARADQVLYHGVLAGNAAWREGVVPRGPTSAGAERVFGVDGWACPSCGERMRRLGGACAGA